jgi:transposase
MGVMESMNEKLLAQLKICKLTKTKPNFSALSREYGIDRRTIKKYYDGYEGKPANRAPHSKLDQYEDLLRSKFTIRGATFRSVYEFMLAEVDDSIGTYSNFRKYVVSRGIAPRKKELGHPRFETAPGHQAQVDWKEDITIRNRNGEPITFNIFDYKLSSSRYSRFIYKTNRTQQDVCDCLIESFRTAGGVPEEILFDNMSSIVSFNHGQRRVSQKMQQFAKDFGFRMRFAKPRSPETKGKVESINKFAGWINVYEGEFETEEDLKAILEKINTKVNTQVNQATNVPPVLLFQKEKDRLQPMPSRRIVEAYLSQERKTRVGKDSTVAYKNARYSVPTKYIGNMVSLRCDDEHLKIYCDDICIADHMICGKRINYAKEHYVELLRPLVKSDDIEAIAEENLRQLDMFL